MSNFPENHPIELIRGLSRPSIPAILKTMARRAAWLSNKVTALSREHGGWQEVRNCGEMRELEAAARIVEILEPRLATCPTCGRGGNNSHATTTT